MRWAEEYGVDFWFETAFEDVIIQNGKVVGAKLRQGEKEFTVSSRLLADCSGIAAAVRTKLPEDNLCENFKLKDSDKFYVTVNYISFLKHDISEYGSSTSTLLLYNLKTQKFKEIESFFGADPVDAYADEKDKTITGFIGMKYAPTVKYVYDFDGNKISEEAEQVEAFNPDDILEDVSVASTQRQQETPLQEFRCRKCGQRVAARNTIEADIKARYGCEPAGSSHSWDYIQF